jgi:hypothetical protein
MALLSTNKKPGEKTSSLTGYQDTPSMSCIPILTSDGRQKASSMKYLRVKSGKDSSLRTKKRSTLTELHTTDTLSSIKDAGCC